MIHLMILFKIYKMHDVSGASRSGLGYNPHHWNMLAPRRNVNKLFLEIFYPFDRILALSLEESAPCQKISDVTLQ